MTAARPQPGATIFKLDGKFVLSPRCQGGSPQRAGSSRRVRRSARFAARKLRKSFAGVFGGRDFKPQPNRSRLYIMYRSATLELLYWITSFIAFVAFAAICAYDRARR